MTLYHYTCDHGRKFLGVRGLLLPRHHPLLVSTVSWLTTDAAPACAEALGLTSDLLSCDRMAYRYRVLDDRGAEPWMASRLRGDNPDWAALLESLDGAEPETWWIAASPLRVALDRTWVRP